MTNGYDFYFKDGSDFLIFPITPGELTIKMGSNNKVVTLIDGGDINILKSPSLTEVEFEARFPMRKYPYSRQVSEFQTYHDKFKELKEKKKSFRFIVSRHGLVDGISWETNILVALEEYTIKESADEGDDVLIDFKLKQFKEYGVRIITTDATTSTSPTTRPNDGKDDSSAYYIVKKGDCLWNIAKKFYGNGAKWTIIYNANKSAIEEDAKKHGRKSSSNGHWIYPGLKLLIPNVNSTGSNSSSSGSSGSDGSGGGKNPGGSPDTPSTASSSTYYTLSIYSYNWNSQLGTITVTVQETTGNKHKTTNTFSSIRSLMYMRVKAGSTIYVQVNPTSKLKNLGSKAGFNMTGASGGWGKISTYKASCGKVSKNMRMNINWGSLL